MTASERAPLGAALAILLALVSLTGAPSAWLMAALTGLLSLLIGIGWPGLLELPSPRGTRIVVAGTGILAAALTLWTAQGENPLWGVVVATALGIFGAFVHQMLRRERELSRKTRPRRMLRQPTEKRKKAETSGKVSTRWERMEAPMRHSKTPRAPMPNSGPRTGK